jgi:uncharacterized protein YdhG (YjbR/CyaY superfamily)
MALEHVSVDDYVSSFHQDVQSSLQVVRRTIRNAAPAAAEKISYQIPTITLNARNVVHVAAWKDHIGLYPIPAGDEAFEREIAPYRAARSTVRLPLGKPIPDDLIARMVALLITQRVEPAQ